MSRVETSWQKKPHTSSTTKYLLFRIGFRVKLLQVAGCMAFEKSSLDGEEEPSSSSSSKGETRLKVVSGVGDAVDAIVRSGVGAAVGVTPTVPKGCHWSVESVAVANC